MPGRNTGGKAKFRKNLFDRNRNKSQPDGGGDQGGRRVARVVLFPAALLGATINRGILLADALRAARLDDVLAPAFAEGLAEIAVASKER